MIIFLTGCLAASIALFLIMVSVQAIRIEKKVESLVTMTETLVERLYKGT